MGDTDESNVEITLVLCIKFKKLELEAKSSSNQHTLQKYETRLKQSKDSTNSGQNPGLKYKIHIVFNENLRI